jgi:Tfp pilus assembly protein PilV
MGKPNALIAALLMGFGVLALDPKYHHLTHQQKVTGIVLVVLIATGLQAAVWLLARAVRRSRQPRRQQGRSQPVRDLWQ